MFIITSSQSIPDWVANKVFYSEQKAERALFSLLGKDYPVKRVYYAIVAM